MVIDWGTLGGLHVFCAVLAWSLLVDLPVTDAKGEAIHRNGISAVPGLYFLGLQWLSKMNSSFLSGVGDDAPAARWIVRLVISLLFWPGADPHAEHQMLQRFVAPAFAESGESQS